MSRLKKVLPLFIITFFLLIIFFYYKNNKSDFFAIQQLDLTLILQIIFLCSTYLVTEAFILKNIVKFLGKNINLIQSFLVMSATYFCNTFIQFSGLGYRIYYLNKFKNTIETTNFDRLKNLEKEQGFSEAKTNFQTGKKVPFFNLGPKNDWRKLLDNKIRKKIEEAFKKEMVELGYL